MSQKPKLLPIMTLHVLSGINCRIHEKFVIGELQSVMMLLLFMVVACWSLLYVAYILRRMLSGSDGPARPSRPSIPTSICKKRGWPRPNGPTVEK